MTDDELVELSKAGMLALDLNEMRAIQAYYREQQREPTDVELENTGTNVVRTLLS